MRRRKVKWDVLAKWPDYLRTIKPSLFDIGQFRDVKNYKEIECQTPGCVLGHMVAFAVSPVPFIQKEHEGWKRGEINFPKFAETELNIKYEDSLWNFLFGEKWTKDSSLKERNFAIRRIEEALKHQHLHPNAEEWIDLNTKFDKQINEQ